MLESAKNTNTAVAKEVVFHVHGVTKVYQMGEVQVLSLIHI